MAGHNALVRQFKQFNGSPPAPTRGRPDDRERSVKLFAEVQKIYRECSPAAAREMCRLALEAEDERVRSVCAGMVMDRAWGKPKEYDPNAEAAKQAPPFDPSLYSTEELRRMQEVMLMIARRQGLMPLEEGDEASEPAVESRDERRFESSHVRGNRC
jgi:hypothetical protein